MRILECDSYIGKHRGDWLNIMKIDQNVLMHNSTGLSVRSIDFTGLCCEDLAPLKDMIATLIRTNQ